MHIEDILINLIYVLFDKRWKIKTNFHNDKIPTEGSQYLCLSVTLINSIYRKDKHYYCQVFLEKCKNVFKQSKTSKFITDDIEISFDDSDRENSGDKNSNKEN